MPVRIRIGGDCVEVGRACFIWLPEFRLRRSINQPAPLHERATNGMLEILHFIAISRPMQGVGPGEPEQRLSIAQPLGVVPGAAIWISVGMAAGAADPATADHGLLSGI